MEIAKSRESVTYSNANKYHMDLMESFHNVCKELTLNYLIFESFDLSSFFNNGDASAIRRVNCHTSGIIASVFQTL